MNYADFNTYEAIFWIALGALSFILHEAVHWQARPVFLEATIWFLLLGISDIVEVFTDGLFRPELWWLVLWKGVCIVGIFHVIYRYLHLRIVLK